jgi:hypothetical protein
VVHEVKIAGTFIRAKGFVGALTVRKTMSAAAVVSESNAPVHQTGAASALLATSAHSLGIHNFLIRDVLISGCSGCGYSML